MRSVARRIFPVILCLCACAYAQDEHAHSTREKLGTVHFETTCKPPAQEEFDRAVALLHSFQFSRSQSAFHGALKADPQCAVAYWGIALADWSNPFAPGIKGAAQMQTGLKDAEQGIAMKPRSDRERDYLDAVAKLYQHYDTTSQAERINAYRDAMEKIAGRYPEDHEASIFYALALAESAPLGDKTHAERLKAGAILEELFKQQPDHPGLAHYIIHTYDVPDLAPKAVDAARRYSQIAPDAPHALHMPSHTFTRVGYWQESIDANIAAAKAARREQQYAEELHASDYQMYAYLQTAQDAAAKKILDSVPEIASHLDLKGGTGGAAPPAAGDYAMAAIPARYALERQDWKAAAALKRPEMPEARKAAAASLLYSDAITWFARGMGAARLKQNAEAQESVDALKVLNQQLLSLHEDYWATQVEIQMVELQAWKELAAGQKEDALKTMTQAASREDTTDKSAVTPGPLAPARELLGEMLLQLGKPKPALEQFQLTLTREPNRFRALYGAGHAAKLAGDKETSRRYFAQLLKTCERADKDARPELAEARADQPK